MARFLLLFILAGLSANVSANPCAMGGRPFPVGEGSGIGGTGLQTGQGDGSGIGGTGHEGGSGIGGTGQQVRNDGDGSGIGGTGVVGEITGFGSICVNELEIHYDAKTPVSVNGQSGRADQLAVGQMVAVHAEGGGASLQAQHIHVRHALVGRVEEVNQAGQFKVWGQWVSPPPSSRVQPGERIKVSGHRADSRHVVASRIDPALEGEPDLLSGEVEWAEGGLAQVSGVRVRLPEGGESPRAGEEIRASGKPEAGGFRAERIQPDDLMGLMGRTDHINMKGRIRPSKQPGKLRVGGVEFSLDAKTRVKVGSGKELLPGRMVRVEARQKDGRAVIERIEVGEEGGRPHDKPKSDAVKDRRGPTKGRQDSRGAEEPGDRDDHEEIEYDEKSGPSEKLEQSEKVETEKAEKVEREEKVEKPKKAEKPEKAEKVEKPEKIEKAEKPEKPEKIEKPEKPEKPEKIERPERPDDD